MSPDTPVTPILLPNALPSPARTPETTWTPGTFVSALADAIEMGEKLSVAVTAYCPVKTELTAFSNVVLSPEARTDTSVTSASPIISADAVEAVRCGLRIALPRASAPAAPPIRTAGQPSTRASGGTSVFASIATPTKTAAAPTPIASSRSVVEMPPTNSPMSMIATAPPIVSRAAATLKRAKRDVGRTAPSRTAEMGGTRVARIAGRSAAMSVMPMPTASETTTVRVAKTVPACGRSIPKCTKSRFSPLASPRPRKRPATAPSAPMTSASSMTERST